MGGWRKYLELQAQAKTGLSSGLFIWALLAVMFGTLTVEFILLIAFIGLAERYDPLTAAIAFAGFFLLVTIIAAICCLWSRRRTMEQAELALAARNRDLARSQSRRRRYSSEPGRRLAQAAGVGMEWFGRDRADVESEEQNGRRKLARAA
jgi:type VI protein secretion system component VasK